MHTWNVQFQLLNQAAVRCYIYRRKIHDDRRKHEVIMRSGNFIAAYARVVISKLTIFSQCESFTECIWWRKQRKICWTQRKMTEGRMAWSNTDAKLNRILQRRKNILKLAFQINTPIIPYVNMLLHFCNTRRVDATDVDSSPQPGNGVRRSKRYAKFFFLFQQLLIVSFRKNAIAILVGIFNRILNNCGIQVDVEYPVSSALI